jgi:antitoxin HicB
MKTEVMKNLDYYRDLPYGIILRKDEDGEWVARIEELPGCTAHGKSRSEALENLEEVETLWIEDALAMGDVIPEPQPNESLPSGKWLQRVPRSLHRKLAELAKREGVSLNQLATSIFAEAVGRRHAPTTAAIHAHSGEALWSFGMPQGAKAEWRFLQAKPRGEVDILAALAATVSTLPNEMSENDCKVIERARKKDLAYKA